MKSSSFFRLLACLAVPMGIAGCGKPDPDAAPIVQPTPTPSSAASASADDGKDFSAKNIRHKADQAANSLEKFLQGQDPKLRAKVQHLADKVSDKLGADKNHWREKLEQQRKALVPQIAQLKQQLDQTGGDKNKEKLKNALSKLEDKSEDTDKKLAELESAGLDAWKHFKSQLSEDEAHDNDTAPTDDAPSTDDATPTPSAHGH